MFYGEAWFNLNGYVKSQISRICSAENSHDFQDFRYPSQKVGKSISNVNQMGDSSLLAIMEISRLAMLYLL